MVFKSVPEQQYAAIQKILAEAERVQALVTSLHRNLMPAPAGTDITSVQVAAIYSLFSMNFVNTFHKHIQSLHGRTNKVREATQAHTQVDQTAGTTVQTAMSDALSLAQALATPHSAPASPVTTEHVHTNTVITGGGGGVGGGSNATKPMAPSQPMQPYGSDHPAAGGGEHTVVPVENQITVQSSASTGTFGYGGMRGGMGLVGALAAARQTLNRRRHDPDELLASPAADHAQSDVEAEYSEPTAHGGPVDDATHQPASAVAAAEAPRPAPLPGEFVPTDDELDDAEDAYEPYPYHPGQPAGH